MIIILDQEKDGIFSWDMVYRIGKEVRAARTENEYVTLGTYATEERAKEVIAEIWETMRGWRGDCVPFYQMPKE